MLESHCSRAYLFSALITRPICFDSLRVTASGHTFLHCLPPHLRVTAPGYTSFSFPNTNTIPLVIHSHTPSASPPSVPWRLEALLLPAKMDANVAGIQILEDEVARAEEQVGLIMDSKKKSTARTEPMSVSKEKTARRQERVGHWGSQKGHGRDDSGIAFCKTGVCETRGAAFGNRKSRCRK